MDSAAFATMGGVYRSSGEKANDDIINHHPPSLQQHHQSADTRQPPTDLVSQAQHALEDLVHAPVQKYEWNDEHTQVFRNGGHMDEPWVAGFLDLIFVAALLKLGDGLYSCDLGLEEYYFCMIEFLLLFHTRTIIDEYMWHFYMDDLWNQTLYFIFVAGVFVMTLMISYTHETLPDGTEECTIEAFHMNTFHWGVIVTRVVVMTYWIMDLVFDVDARSRYWMMPLRCLPSIILSILAICINVFWHFRRSDEYWILLAIVVSEYYFHYWKALHKYPLLHVSTWWPVSKLVKKHQDHGHERLFKCDEELDLVQERCEMFMLLVFGESVIQLLLPSFKLYHRYETLFLTLCGLLLVWSIAKQFFDAAHRVAHGHALRRSEAAGTLWIVLHGIAGFFTFTMGIGIKLLYKDLRYGRPTPFAHEMTLSIGCGISVICHVIMRFLHKGWGEYPENRGRLMLYALRFFIGGLHFSVSMVYRWNVYHAEYLVLTHCVIAAILNTVDIFTFSASEHVEAPNDGHATYESSEKCARVDSLHPMAAPVQPSHIIKPLNVDEIDEQTISSLSRVGNWVFKGRKERASQNKTGNDATVVVGGVKLIDPSHA